MHVDKAWYGLFLNDRRHGGIANPSVRDMHNP